MRCRFAFVGVSFLLLTAPLAARQDDVRGDVETRGVSAELAKVNVLLVVDTSSNLKESVSVDGERMEHLLRDTIPGNRLQLRVLTGGEVNEKTILATLRAMPVSGSDALLFYYAGHGATDQQKGHYLAFQEGKGGILLRSTLRQALRDKESGLVVLLTDCCSNRVPLPKKYKRPARPLPTEIHPVVRQLFFQHRGIVDVTASASSTSFGDDDEGGVFTRTLAALLESDAKRFDKNRDGFVSWHEFYPQLEEETEQTFKRWAKAMQARGEKIGAASQRPMQFALAEPLAAVGGEVTFAVIGLRNAGDKPLVYQYRWGADKAWARASLDAGKTIVWTYRLSDGKGETPEFEVLLDGDKEATKLKAKSWFGRGSPTYAAVPKGGKYKIESDTKATRGVEDKTEP